MASYARYRYESDGEQVKILSIEHDEKWYESQRAVLSKLDLLNRVHLVHSPLGTQTYSAQQVVCYSTIGTAPNQLDLESKAHFVFVDGPVGLQHGGAGRGGSILQSIALAREGATILVHDALRSDEFGWIREFHHARSQHFVCRGIVPLWYGLAVCEKKCPKT